MGNKQAEQIKRNKLVRKFVIIQKSEVVKKHLNTKYKSWQLKLCKLIGVEPADAYQYAFRISYKSSNARLRVNDVVSTEDGEIFGVMREENRIAMLASSEAYIHKPKMYGKLFIIEKPKNK